MLSRSLLSASAMALLASSAAPVSGQTFFGFDHTALGQAQLSQTAEGHLQIDNLGSSGKDGVSIDAGAFGQLMLEMSIGPAGALAPGSKTTEYLFVEGFSEQQCVEICEADGGSATLSYMPIGFEPTCVTVRLLVGGVVVDSREFAPPLPAALVTGDLGDDPVTGEGVRIFATKKGYDYYQAQSDMSIVGSPTGPVQADEVQIEVFPFRQEFGPVLLQMANHPGPVTVRSEAILLQHDDITTDGSFDGLSNSVLTSALGGASISGVCGINICAGCPECCDPPPADPLIPTCGVSVDNLGSSGQDGVRFASCCDGGTTFQDDWAEPLVGMSPTDLPDPQDALRCSATGVFNGSSGSDLGSISFVRDVDAVLLSADYSSVGTNTALVEVYDDGALVGSYKTQVGPGIVLGTIQPSAAGLNINKCGKFGGVGSTPCFIACTSDDFTLFGGGQVLTGNDVRVLALNPAGTYEGVEALDIRGRNIDGFSARMLQTNPDGPQTVIAGGLAHTTFGGAQLTVEADGSLTVDNLGSSGKDGVSVALGGGQGASFDLGDGYRLSRGVDSFFDIAYRADDGSVIGETHFASVDPSTATMTVDFQNPALQLTVSLIDADNQLIHSSQIPNGSPITLSVSGGSAVTMKKVAKFKAGADLAKKVNMAGPVDVTVPEGSFADCVRLVVTTNDSSAALKKGDRISLVGFGSFSVSKSRIMVFGSGHSATGAARLLADDCDDHASIAQLFMANIGSSGLDGVAVDLDDYEDDDSDDDGVPDLRRAGSIRMTVQQNCDDDCDPIGLCWSMEYRDEFGDLESSDVCFNPLPNGDVSVDVSSIPWMAPEAIRVRAIDQNGQVVGEASGLMPGPVATLHSSSLRQLLSPRGQYQTDIGHYPRRNSGVTPPPGTIEVESMRCVIRTGAPMLVGLPGAKDLVSATSLEIGARHSGGQTAFIEKLSKADAKRALDGFAALGPSGGPVSLFLESETIRAFRPVCHADCAPVNADGTTGNDIINIDDLFAVVNAISTQDHRCDVAPDNGDGTAGNLSVNFDDVIKIINDFGPCP